jgi:TonB family protein
MKTAGITVFSGLFLCLALSAAHAQISPAGPDPQAYDTPPILIHPELGHYTAAARAANITGKVTVLLTVDTNGNPTRVHVLHGLGQGLDIAAVEAVKLDRFKPATKDGQPVLAPIKLDVPFDPAVNPGP